MATTMNPQELIGKTIAGRYRIDRLLGQGAMGAVFAATQLSMDRQVALKLLHGSLATQKTIVERFSREMKAASKVDHQHTIGVYDFGETEDGQLFLAMELVNGRPLSDELDRTGVMDVPRALRIATQIAMALNAAHQEGIVHRDLKPDNVMLIDRYGESDFVKVLDFGIARFLDETATQLTNEGQVVGTPMYMSPEQAQGSHVDHRADIYALGVMLYEMCLGRVPFQSETMVGLLLAHANEPVPPPSDVAPGRVPPQVEDAILRMLAKQPDQRPQTASEVVSLLESCMGAAQAHGGSGTEAVGAVPAKGGASTGFGTVPMGQAPPGQQPSGGSGGGRKSKLPLVIGLGVLLGLGAVAAVIATTGGGGGGEDPIAEADAGSTEEPPPEDGSDAGAEEPPPEDEDKPDAGAEEGEPDGEAAAAADVQEDKPRGWEQADTKAAQAGGDEDAGPTAAADVAPEVEGPDPVEGLRAQLAKVFEQLEEPLPPEKCRTKDEALLSHLVRAGGMLAEGHMGKKGGIEAVGLNMLKGIAGAGEGSAEFQVLVAQGENVAGNAEATQAAGAAAVTLCPEWAAGYNAQGLGAMNAKDTASAKGAFRKAVALAPDYLKPLRNLAVAEYLGGNSAAALDATDQLLKKAPGDAHARIIRGSVWLQLKKPAKAVADLELALEKDGSLDSAWLVLASARMQMGDKKRGKEAICKAAALGNAQAAKICPESAPPKPEQPPAPEPPDGAEDGAKAPEDGAKAPDEAPAGDGDTPADEKAPE